MTWPARSGLAQAAHLCCFWLGVAVDAGADGGEGKVLQAVLVGQLKGTPADRGSRQQKSAERSAVRGAGSSSSSGSSKVGHEPR